MLIWEKYQQQVVAGEGRVLEGDSLTLGHRHIPLQGWRFSSDN